MIITAAELHIELGKVTLAIEGVRFAYRSDWNDVVHESFRKFFTKLTEKEMELTKAKVKTDATCAKISLIKDNNYFKAKANTLKMSVSGIIV